MDERQPCRRSGAAVGVRPSPDELEFERRALVMFVGLIWWRSSNSARTARAPRTRTPAPVCTRWPRSLALCPDSFAAEILSSS